MYHIYQFISYIWCQLQLRWFIRKLFSLKWGKHIISIDSDDELPYCDGKNNNGKIMNSGVYFYRITYRVNIHNIPDQKEKTGYFYLYK